MRIRVAVTSHNRHVTYRGYTITAVMNVHTFSRENVSRCFPLVNIRAASQRAYVPYRLRLLHVNPRWIYIE